MIASVVLSPEMQACVALMEATDGSLYRYPGGIWATERGKRWGGDVFGTRTVTALVKRHVAAWSEWKEGPLGRFPVRVTLAARLDETVAPLLYPSRLQ